MKPRDYWEEALANSFEEHGVAATNDQLAAIAADIETSHDNYGMAFYSPPDGEYLNRENRELREKLKAERAKVPCQTCGSTGSITNYGPYHSATSTCWKCRGEGRHAP